MGAGIAEISIHRDMDVWIKDVSMQNLGAGERQIYRDLQKKVNRRIISPFRRDEMLSRLHGTLNYQSFKNVAWVIEAVFEDLDLKQRVLKEVEAVTGDRVIFASNTSSLPIADIARAAKRPEQVIGMHYFSPVPKMPLLEIIVTPRTAKWVTATAVAIGIRQGKIPIVVNDGPGFYTTRILAPMLNEALLLLEAGGDIRHIDTVMKNFGFPVGPLTLIDEVGIDVGAHVSEVLSDMFSARGVVSGNTMHTLLQAGFKGRKNKRGFYLYPDGAKKRRKKRKKVNPAIYRFLGEAKRQPLDDKDIQERLLLIMIGEALRCLEEGILREPLDGDVGAVLGLGFPPFLGGPFRYGDRVTPAVLIGKMEQLESSQGARFSPPSILRDYADGNKKFYK